MGRKSTKTENSPSTSKTKKINSKLGKKALKRLRKLFTKKVEEFGFDHSFSQYISEWAKKVNDSEENVKRWLRNRKNYEAKKRRRAGTFTSIKAVLDIYENGKHYDSSKTFLDAEVIEKMQVGTGFPKPDINRWFQNKKYKEKYEEFVEQELERLWSQITRGVDFLKGLSISKSFSKIMAHKESQPYMKKFLDEKELRSDDFEYEFLIRRMTKLSRDEATHLVNVYRISEDKSFELFNEFAKRTSFSNMETRRFYVDVVKMFGSNYDEEKDVDKDEKEDRRRRDFKIE